MSETIYDFNQIRATFVCNKCHGKQTAIGGRHDTDGAGRPTVVVTFTHWCPYEKDDSDPAPREKEREE